jgi:hypothetical protein
MSLILGTRRHPSAGEAFAARLIREECNQYATGPITIGSQYETSR